MHRVFKKYSATLGNTVYCRAMAFSLPLFSVLSVTIIRATSDLTPTFIYYEGSSLQACAIVQFYLFFGKIVLLPSLRCYSELCPLK